MNDVINLCEKFYNQKVISLEEFKFLFNLKDAKDLHEYARKLSLKNFGNKIYIRGLIEISTYCKNNCYYCGLRNANENVNRVRLTKEEIISRVQYAKSFNINTIVLQGGEDDFYDIDYLEEIIKGIKEVHKDTALTLSLGERSVDDLERLKNIGADRYLLRHETNSKIHYEKLHPKSMSFDNRISTIFKLKEMGFQTGCGMMIGSPFQTIENLYEDLNLILKLKPQMVGIGPFIPNKDTPFRDYPAGKLEDVLKILSIVRIANEKILLPATTALGSIHKTGRELGILAGANVLMPNLGEEKIRKNYTLYNNKIGTQIENSDDYIGLSDKLKKIGYEISTSRGDYNRKKEKDV
ncbi:[FeFe] hydrogenase H-cluster radical SAM maturase HydE [Peptoniphilus sp. MSJ-1]|uniref:[FeFe] hydrogenase H-cluster radical SAM maturase HydE n=1 Tax=Peptoniphilus ovalis TaxID=2841503 RepID=A0ABS6FJ23_9FIRM|nr:[FeFe] hydrogenase H-cluster radical SAM maturase HydE [Peptoniphilus ovalis]MBU5670178.1 [FeFe] hydrogenase H-cluster radical SAM maturase HydE [Peptoniphilus ovalis]